MVEFELQEWKRAMEAFNKCKSVWASAANMLKSAGHEWVFRSAVICFPGPSTRSWPVPSLRKAPFCTASALRKYLPTSVTVLTTLVSNAACSRTRPVYPHGLWGTNGGDSGNNGSGVVSRCRSSSSLYHEMLYSLEFRGPKRHQRLDADETDWWRRWDDGWETGGEYVTYTHWTRPKSCLLALIPICSRTAWMNRLSCRFLRHLEVCVEPLSLSSNL